MKSRRDFIEDYIEKLEKIINLNEDFIPDQYYSHESDIYDLIRETARVFRSDIPDIEELLSLAKGKAVQDARTLIGILSWFLVSEVNEIEQHDAIDEKSPKVFISHSHEDKRYVKNLVELLEAIGLNNENSLFCSSVPGYSVPLNVNFYDYLRNQFNDFDVHVLFILSNNYYNSTACLNEMGAAWVLKNSYTSILLPSFTFNEIEGAIDPMKISIKLDAETNEVRHRLDQFKEKIETIFNIEEIPRSRWEMKRNQFIETSIAEKHM